MGIPRVLFAASVCVGVGSFVACCLPFPNRPTPPPDPTMSSRGASESEEGYRQRKKEFEVNLRLYKENQEREAAAKRESEKRAEEEERKAAATRPGVTRDNYARLKLGMSLSEAQDILGPGKEAGSGPGVLIVTWQSGGGFSQPTIISATFQNGKMINRAIAGR